MDISLHYREQGEGRPLILLHGNGEDGSYFANQITFFSDRYRVIAVDTRGHGKSPRGTAPFTMEQFAADLHNLMDKLQIQKAVILGFSDGANIAMKFALKYPEQVKALILNGGNLTPKGVKKSIQIPIEIGYRLTGLFAGKSKEAKSHMEILGLMVNEPDINPEELRSIQVPALVIAGTRDMIKQSHTQIIAQSIPNAKLRIIPGDHFIANKSPERFNREVDDFLKAGDYVINTDDKSVKQIVNEMNPVIDSDAEKQKNSRMENLMQGFIRISKYAGMRNDLAQAGGGNTSVKLDEQIMLVKSSGFQLADVNGNTGYSKIDYRLIEEYFKENMQAGGQSVLTEDAGNALLAKAQISGGRASIETFLHAVTGKYTLHSHPTLVNILTSRKDGRDILEELFPEAVFVPYRKPGAALAETYYQICQAAGKPEVIFLESHGLVASGDTAEKVIGLTEEVLEKIAAYLQVSYEAYPNATKLWDVFGEIPAMADRIVYLSENRFLSKETAEGDILTEEKWNHAFCPDCVVYGSKKPLFLADDFGGKDINAFIEKNGIPAMVFFKGHFYILAESVKKAQEIENVMSFAAQVQAANLPHEMRFLSDGQQDALLNWDAEKYRRKL